jgi:hypothetical protein
MLKTTQTSSVGKRLTNSLSTCGGIALTARRALDRHADALTSHVFTAVNDLDVVEGVPGSYDAYTIVNAMSAMHSTRP